MLHKTITKHVSRFHAHIQEHGHKRALIMIMSSMVMMFYPYFSTRADLLPSGGDITVQYSPDNLVDVNTDVVATVVYNSASGVTFAESDTYTFTENGQYTFEYYEDGVTGTITAQVDWIDKEVPTGIVGYQGPISNLGPVTATLDTSEDVIVTSNGGPVHVFTENGTFLFTFVDPAGNTGSVLAEVTSIVTGGICGNAIVETPEQCDDGNLLNGDGCNSICELETNGGGNGGGGPSQDVCPNGDLSQNFYDGLCEEPEEEQDIVCNMSGIDLAYTRSGNEITFTWTDFLQSGYDLNIDGFAPNTQELNIPMSDESFTYTLTTTGQQIVLFSIVDQNQISICNQTVIYPITEDVIITTPPTPTLTGITATVSYTSGTTVTATATGFNMAGVFAVNNSNSLSYIFTSPGSFTFALQTVGGNTGSVTATATTGMFITTGTTTPPPNTVNTGVVCDAGDLVLTGALGGVYSLTTPVVVGGLFSINWAAANNHCNPDQIVTIQLRDHNGQWITLGTGELDGTGVAFRSTGLAYTGLYSIFGTHASGSIYTYTGQSGQQLTGAYTVDTPYTIYAGSYTGSYTGLWTGYQVRIINASGVNLLSGARPFTIDNTVPSATGFTFIVGGANASGVVGSGGTFTLSFVGSELLSNIQLLVNNTLIKSWTGGSTTGYSLTGGFGATNMAGPIAYVVNFTDAAGNTGSVTGTNIYTIDTIDPNFQAFAVSGSAASGVKFTWNTSKSTVYSLRFSLSGSIGVVVPVTTTTYATSHTYTTTALATGKTYLFNIKINDALQNTNFMSGTVVVNASGATSITIATQNNNVLQLSSQVEAKLFSQILKEEIKKFESCKSDIDFKSTTIPLKGNKSINLKIPEMEKNSTKTIVQAFSLMLVNKLKSANLSVSEIDETETKVNNFFVILKLLKDDKGDCKQNLSAYYINQFERIMDEMLK